MPKHVDHCRSCGTTVLIEPFDDQPATGEVCEGCHRTVCLNSCKRNSCPHQPYQRTPSSVPEAEHEALKAQLNDPAALEVRLKELYAARGVQKVEI
jgi:hypothetical protein